MTDENHVDVQLPDSLNGALDIGRRTVVPPHCVNCDSHWTATTAERF
jgi:hypothetical protein